MKRFSKFYIGLILFLLFAPIAVMIFFSFNEGKSTAVFSGFSIKWYAELFSNSEILNALKNSLILAVASAAISTVLGTAAAFGIHHMKQKHFRQSLMTVTNIPIMNPEIITGISMMFLFVFVGGILNLSTKLNFWTMLIAHITFCLPYVILNVLPKFKQMDKSLPEAALDLGCTPMQSFFKVQLPAIMPGVITGMLMSFTLSFDDFVISYFTSGTDFQTLPILVYSMTKKSVKPTIYALSTIVFVLILVLLLITNREKSSAEALEAKKAKLEKKRKQAIARANKSKKQKLASSTVVNDNPQPSHKRSGYTGKIVALVCAVTLIVGLCVSIGVYTGETVTLNVYNWGEYISDGSDDSLDVNEAFEEYCRDTLGMKVKVNYVTYTSNEDMYAKLSAGAVSYDVIVPSDYMIARLADEKLLQELNFDNIPNYEKCISDDFKGLYYDPENKFSVPYTYGMIGVIYDANRVDAEDTGDWDLMWNSKYTGQIVQFNNARDAFGTAFYKLGLDVNTTDTAAWDAGLAELKLQKPHLKKLVMDEVFNMMETGEAAIGAYYAGDYLTMVENQAENVDLRFYYPENTNLFVDAMCIPTCAQNKELAEAYINFMLGKEAATANAEYICYASPNSLVVNNPEYIDYMGEDGMAVLYPEGFDFAAKYNENCYKDLDKSTKEHLNSKWEEFKTGMDDEQEGFFEASDWIIIAAISGSVVWLITAKIIKRCRMRKTLKTVRAGKQ
ncbi:MAG: extracellular solute-binding protein [Ruminococcaceae bacterium]|nr:extracellular solute-binding protein [Oscillospiraceae bacterium]